MASNNKSENIYVWDTDKSPLPTHYEASPEDIRGEDPPILTFSENAFEHHHHSVHESKETNTEKVKRAGLVAEVPNDKKEEAKKLAMEFAENAEITWAGRKPESLLDDLASVKNGILKRLGITHEAQIPAESRQAVKQEIVKSLVEKARGFIGERVSAAIPLDGAETAFVSIDTRDKEMNQIGKYPQKDVSESFGGTKKDVIIAGFKLAPFVEDLKFLQEVVNSSTNKPPETATAADKVSFEFVEVAAKAAAAVYLNYNNEVAKYEGDTGYMHPQTEAVIFKKITDSFEMDEHGKVKELNKKQKATVRYIISWANEAAGRNLFTNDKGPGIYARVEALVDDQVDTASKERAAKLFNESYQNITIPDAITTLTKESSTITGAAEVKTYTTEEIDQWIKWLRQADREEKEKDFELKGTSASGEVLISNGLQVTHFEVKNGVVGEQITFGPDIEAERNFARLVNGEANNIPIIIRLPGNATMEQMRELFEIAGDRGITNIAIQRLPVSVSHVHAVANEIIKYNLIPTAKSRERRSALDLEILNDMLTSDAWGF